MKKQLALFLTFFMSVSSALTISASAEKLYQEIEETYLKTTSLEWQNNIDRCIHTRSNDALWDLGKRKNRLLSEVILISTSQKDIIDRTLAAALAGITLIGIGITCHYADLKEFSIYCTGWGIGCGLLSTYEHFYRNNINLTYLKKDIKNIELVIERLRTLKTKV